MTRQTRDRLAEPTRERGVPISTMLAELAVQAQREGVFHSEREASRADADAPEVGAEEADWETALGDGID